ncbi:hypothetical protein [Deinococcus daejeonensis]|uniref:Uncharacterized protein n=1 Tax=Deinococcus daejeonensis TaxID=1007098 RepID=A0ABQ2J5B3_9DEIO|nr:hypothetical protein [Deinococcus daejeonensis]GGN38058.1 hypothetical protein GCM10010842_20550 [Deinococcus daejeonensis]
MTLIPLCEICTSAPSVTRVEAHRCCAACAQRLRFEDRLIHDLQMRIRREALPAVQQVLVLWARDWADTTLFPDDLLRLAEVSLEMIGDDLVHLAGVLIEP